MAHCNISMVKIFLLLLITSITACNKTIDLPGFDEAKWKEDKNGCQNMRTGMVNDLKQVKNQLKGFNANDIIDVLGKPDKNELYERNQKFFIYEISNAPECIKQNDHKHLFLSIRFNATGLAKEIMIYQD